MKKKAVILLSGGLDSTTCLAIAKDLGFEIYALSFDYGQKNKIEISAAKKIAKKFAVKEHKIAKIDLRVFGGSALTSAIKVPKSKKAVDSKKIPITYVPARNTIFLSFALCYAETVKAFDIFIGANAVDYSGYPDCRPKFIRAFEELANLATAAADGDKKFTIHAPLIDMKKSEIIASGLKLGVDYSMTKSCYDPILKSGKYYPCGACDACKLRDEGFRELESVIHIC